jgi:hypothetical protein
VSPHPIYFSANSSIAGGKIAYQRTLQVRLKEMVRLYRLTLDVPVRNTQPRYNICATTTIDAVIEHEAKRELVPMRWDLVPSWWKKPIKELRLATFQRPPVNNSRRVPPPPPPARTGSARNARAAVSPAAQRRAHAVAFGAVCEPPQANSGSQPSRRATGAKPCSKTRRSPVSAPKWLTWMISSSAPGPRDAREMRHHHVEGNVGKAKALRIHHRQRLDMGEPALDHQLVRLAQHWLGIVDADDSVPG